MDQAIEVEPELKPLSDQPLRTILIIDDDLDQIETLAFLLRGQGFDIATASTGSTGRRLAKDLHPAAILLDIELPDDNGLSICGDLVDDPATSEIPILLVSGVDRPQSIRQARAAGSTFYIHKPYDPNALLVLLDRALGERF